MFTVHKMLVVIDICYFWLSVLILSAPIFLPVGMVLVEVSLPPKGSNRKLRVGQWISHIFLVTVAGSGVLI